MKNIILAFLSLELIALGAVRAQAPTGAIAGVVTDPAGAVIPSARVVARNKETGLKRALATGARKHFFGKWRLGHRNESVRTGGPLPHHHFSLIVLFQSGQRRSGN